MDELKYQAMLQELEIQRAWALTRSAQLAGEVAAANQKVDALTKEAETLRPKTKELESAPKKKAPNPANM